MPIYKQTTEITNIDDLLSSIERDIEEVYFGDKQVFTVWATYDGTLPAQYSANGSMLADYRIYGASGGVGDDSGTEPAGYKAPMSITENIYSQAATDPNNGYMSDHYMQETGEPAANNAWHITEYIPIDSTNKYVVYYAQQGYYTGVAFYDLQKNYLSGQNYMAQMPFTLTVPQNAAYARFSIINSTYYQTPSIKESEIISIYIGSDPLGEDEYVDYGEQKVYRMSGGILTPTDPPVPLPALPTVDGTTITDYAGQSAAPSRFYAKYRKGGY
jgi:hypothetical protein